MLRVFRLTLTFLILGGVAFGAYTWRQRTEEAQRKAWEQLPRATVERGDLVVTVDETGVLDVRQKTYIVSPLHGDLTKVVENGQWVEAGQPIFWFSTERLEEEYNEDLGYFLEAQTDIDQISAQLERLTDNQEMDMELEIAELFFERLRLEDRVQKLAVDEALSEEEIIAKRQVEQAELKASSSGSKAQQRDFSYQEEIEDQGSDRQRRIRSMQKAIRRRDNSFERAKRAADRIENAVVSAPTSGVLQLLYTYDRVAHKSIPIKTGTHINPGQDLAAIPDLKTMIARSQAPEAKIRQIPLGTSVSLRLDAVGTATFRGHVVMIGSAAIERDESPGGSILASQDLENEKVFAVEIEFGPLDTRLRPGMTANTSFEVERQEDTLIVPLEAIHHVDGKTVVYLDRGERAVAIPVTTGLHTNDLVAVSGDLKDQDTLLLVSPEDIEHGE